MKKLSLICAVLLLSACGSGSNSYDVGPPAGGPATPSPPTSMVDAFFTTVSQYLTPSGEDTDPTPIDSVVATQPEDSEPSELS